MQWYARFGDDPRVGPMLRRAAGRPRWVYTGTIGVVALVLAAPLMLLVLALIVAGAVGFVVFTVLDALARLLGAGRSRQADGDAGERENVRVVERSFGDTG